MRKRTGRVRTTDTLRDTPRGTRQEGGSRPEGGVSIRVGVPSVPELVVFTGINDLGCAHMAAAWFPMLADPQKARAVLASPRGSIRLSPEIVAAMGESGVESKVVRPQILTPELLASADLVVTMGETFERGFLLTHGPLHREHWMVEPEPVNTDGPGRARSLRDLIRSRVAMLVFTEGWGRADISREAARVTRPRWHAEAFATF